MRFSDKTLYDIHISLIRIFFYNEIYSTRLRWVFFPIKTDLRSIHVLKQFYCKNPLHKPFINWTPQQIRNPWAPLWSDITKNWQSYVCAPGAEGAGVRGRGAIDYTTAARRRDKLHTETYRGISPLGREYSFRSKASQMAERGILYSKWITRPRAFRSSLFFPYTFRARLQVESHLGSVLFHKNIWSVLTEWEHRL